VHLWCTYITIVGCIFYLVFYKSYIYILLQKTEQVHMSNLLILNSIPFVAAQFHRVAYLHRILNNFSYFGYFVRSALPLGLPRILILTKVINLDFQNSNYCANLKAGVMRCYFFCNYCNRLIFFDYFLYLEPC